MGYSGLLFPATVNPHQSGFTVAGDDWPLSGEPYECSAEPRG